MGPEDKPFGALLTYLRETRGFDFSGYKPASLERRIRKRMQQIHVNSFEDYLDYLEVHPQEFALLFNTILINVTGFFRDPEAWEYLRDEIVPRLLAGKAAEDPIRAWSAGVASGEEAYSLAMLLAEALGEEQFLQRVKIYATDVDEEALARARSATYREREVAGIPEGLLAKYFERSNDLYLFRRDLRRALIFGRHDLLQDPPIPRLDFLICRNTLMYFNSEAQGRILTRFHFALNDAGLLFLGKAEMLFNHGNLFYALDAKRRLFAKSGHVDMRDRLLLMTRNGNEEAAGHLTRHVRFREAAFDSGPAAQMVLDLNGSLAIVNARARKLFGITNRDIGRSFYDLTPAAQMIRLRACVQQALAGLRPGGPEAMEWQLPGGEAVLLDVRAEPLLQNGGAPLGISVTFSDITTQRRLQTELEHTGEELQASLEELQSTNAELETTNEELQSTVEELQTMNEELQSANEELETMNEEQQVTSEELQTVNDELQQRSSDVNHANLYLYSILNSLRSGVAVINAQQQVQVWNSQAEELWGLRSEEVVGQHFLNLDIGLPVEQLRQAVRSCINGQAAHEELTIEATNRRGRAIHCRVSFMPLVAPSHELNGAIIFMEKVGD